VLIFAQNALESVLETSLAPILMSIYRMILPYVPEDKALSHYRLVDAFCRKPVFSAPVSCVC
jgi:hypothetical protein